MTAFDLQAKNLAQAFFSLAARMPNAIVYTQAQISGNDPAPRQKTQRTFSEVSARICTIAHYLKQIGVERGSTVAIISATRPEWMELDLAIASLGAVSASVYQSLPAHEIAYILYDSKSSFVVAENSEQVAKVLSLLDSQIQIAATEDREATTTTLSFTRIIAIETVDAHPLVVQLSDILGAPNTSIPESVESIQANELSALVYTSGTTGPPKGVIQTHGNHLANVRQAFESGLLTDQSRICLVLPLAHSFAKLIGYLGFLSPAVLIFPAVLDKRTSRASPQSISKDIREADATILPLVPRLMEKLQEGVLSAASEKSLKGRLLSVTVTAATTRFALQKEGRFVPPLVRLRFLLTKPLRKKIRTTLFGTKLHYLLSGGAKLPLSVSEFYSALEITPIEGYGLTETVVALTVGRVGQTPLGSVGPVLSSDIELRITEDGELLCRGPNVSSGYYQRPTATSLSWDAEGWFHTGDLARLDEHGNLYITGRKKDIIVTSGGKNIAPLDIEQDIQSFGLVSQAVVIGDGRKYCIALVSIGQDALRHFATSINETTLLTQDPRVQDAVWKHVQKINEKRPSFETIKRIVVVPEEFSVDNGLLTPSFKVKRAAVEKRYIEEIEKAYSRGE